MSSKKLFVFDSTRHPYEGFYKEATEQDLLERGYVTKEYLIKKMEMIITCMDAKWIQKLKELEPYHKTIDGQRFIAWGLIKNLIKEVSRNEQ